MRIAAVTGFVAVTALVAIGCEDGVTPTVDTSIVLPGGGIETTVPIGTDPQMTPAPNPNAGGGGAAPSPSDGTAAP